MDWKSVAEKIVQDDQNKWDKRTLAEDLEVAQVEDGVWPFSDLGISQFCGKLGIPVRYFRRLPDNLKITLGNYELQRLKGTSFLVRGKGDWIRAFLSDQYVAYNNSEIVETVEKLLAKGDVSVKDFVLEETNMYLKIVSDEIWDVESGIKAGIMIGNSEVGAASVSVEPFVFRKPCTNDLIVSWEKSFRHAHIHLTEYEMTRRMAEAVSEGFRVASSVLNAFLKTREDPISDPLETIRTISASRNFSHKLTDEVVSSYLVEPEPNRFGVINAFTNAAQQMAPLQRIEMERFAGTLLDTLL
jgi:hypothetical protein